MKYFITLYVIIFLTTLDLSGQSSFEHTVELESVNVPNLPGLHSYAFGQHNGMWLIIGGRKDGLHARQPFNTFPQSQNNSDIYVVDVTSLQYWSSSVNSLPTGIKEQLQSTNMNFYQDGDTLYIIGGYSYAESANSHITFPSLTSIQVSSIINAVINQDPITPYFKQISDDKFAITGGQLGKIGSTFYLVGGQRFDGLYNPMGHPTHTQTYSEQIRKFTINNSGPQLSFDSYSAITDALHLHRRDYNLLPQIFPDGTEGYTISSGVFQLTADLPFLYPVDVTATGHLPITSFNQYLSNYHSAKVCLFDSINNEMHSLFFGGMSQYYYDNGIMVQDDRVPFVKTISRLTRFPDGSLQEFLMPVEMPELQGASAEFIPNNSLPHYSSEIIKLGEIGQDTILIGHIYGGIHSESLNPFIFNQTSNTKADPNIYAVRLIHQKPAGILEVDGTNPYSVTIYPNPSSNEIRIEYDLDKVIECNFLVSTINGQIIQQGRFFNSFIGLNKARIVIKESFQSQLLLVTVIFDNKYYVSQKILVR